MASDQQHKRLKEAAWVELSEKLLDRLCGRMSLMQSPEERRQVIVAALDEVWGVREHEPFPDLATEQDRHDFLQAFLSYGLLEEFLQDPSVEDVMVNAMDPIFVHKTDVGLVDTKKRFRSSHELALFVKKLIVFGGRTELEPINDIELVDKQGRVNIVSSPFGSQITITRSKEHPLSILELVGKGTLTYDLAAQLWMYVEGLCVRPANLIIAGGPGAGKTTLLNALLSFIPPSERLVVIEDTLELNTEFLENCSRLESARSMPMAALVKNSLRMRPDRIIVGEVRGEEARDFMTAVNIGKYCMGTVHASTGRETIIRLQNEPMKVPETLVNLVDVFVILRRFNIGGKVWRVVSDVVETAGIEQRIVLLSNVWSYDPEQRQTVETSPSSVYRDRLAHASGLSARHIMEETTRRAKLLQLMHANKRLTDIAAITRFCQLYVADPHQAVAQLETTVEALGA